MHFKDFFTASDGCPMMAYVEKLSWQLDKWYVVYATRACLKARLRVKGLTNF